MDWSGVRRPVDLTVKVEKEEDNDVDKDRRETLGN